MTSPPRSPALARKNAAAPARMTRPRSLSDAAKSTSSSLGDYLSNVAPSLFILLPDDLLCRIFDVLRREDPPALGACALVCRRFARFALPVLQQLPLPPLRLRALADIAEIGRILSYHKPSALRALFRTVAGSNVPSTAEWNDHPFWSHKRSRLRGLICGAFDRRSRFKDAAIAELRFLHGEKLYHVMALNNRKQKLFSTRYLTKRDCGVVFSLFLKATKGDFVLAYKELTQPDSEDESSHGTSSLVRSLVARFAVFHVFVAVG